MIKNTQSSHFFALEEPSLLSYYKSYLSSIAIFEARKAHLPLVYASRTFCSLCAASEQALLGSSLAKALRLSANEECNVFNALKNCCPVSLRFSALCLEASFHPFLNDRTGMIMYWILCFTSTTFAETIKAGNFEQNDPLSIDDHAISCSLHDFPAILTLECAREDCRICDCTIASTNCTFVQQFGFTADEIMQHGIDGFLGPDTDRHVFGQIQASIIEGLSGAWKVLLYTKESCCKWCYLQLCALPCGKAFLGIVVDVTRRHLQQIGAYSVGKVIGQGTFGTVRVGRNILTGEMVALKMVDTQTLMHLDELQQLQDEVSALSALRHPRIIRLYSTQQVQSKFYFIMEFAPGGSLKELLDSQDNRSISETKARHYFEQMVNGLDYCHRRDLKPENCLLDEHGNIKIADFGLAGITTPFNATLSDTCGTVEFTAPEVFKGQKYNGSAADMWSLGAVLYEMLMGKSPFKNSSPQATAKAVCKGLYEPLPVDFSDHCKSLVSGLLQVVPEKRMTMEQTICHPWLLGDVSHRDEFHLSTAEEKGKATSPSSRDSSPSDIQFSSTAVRHNSLRLVVPNDLEELSLLLEERGGTALESYQSSPRQSPAHQVLNNCSEKQRIKSISNSVLSSQ